MSYKFIKNIIKGIVESYQGDLYFKYGTLNELNSSNQNFPLFWLVTPLTVVDSATDKDATRAERYSIVYRVVSSGKIDTLTDDADNAYEQTKMIGDGVYYKLLDVSQLITVNAVTKRQLWKVADDVHIGWEYTFTIDYYPDIDYCCTPFGGL